MCSYSWLVLNPHLVAFVAFVARHFIKNMVIAHLLITAQCSTINFDENMLAFNISIYPEALFPPRDFTVNDPTKKQPKLKPLQDSDHISLIPGGWKLGR